MKAATFKVNDSVNNVSSNEDITDSATGRNSSSVLLQVALASASKSNSSSSPSDLSSSDVAFFSRVRFFQE